MKFEPQTSVAQPGNARVHSRFFEFRIEVGQDGCGRRLVFKPIDADLNFNNAKFSREANFTESSFEETAFFSEGRFCGSSFFSKATFNKRASFVQTAFSRVDFIDTTFDQRVSFDTTTFSSDCLFINTTFGGAVEFTKTYFTKANIWFHNNRFKDRVIFFGSEDALIFAGVKEFKFHRVMTDSRGSITFINADLTRCEFLDTDLRHVHFTGVKWPRIFARNVVYDEVLRVDRRP